ncbi:hypothetical protein [Actinokineospora enzanensis]|uniref:hypothetical protein n=1 Tax=Actinokineospora enzanensis TaxID=155975 RepID=UPI0012EBE243|nr:hypothetical protein [Actinokineospora enzanensis]
MAGRRGGRQLRSRYFFGALAASELLLCLVITTVVSVFPGGDWVRDFLTVLPVVVLGSGVVLLVDRVEFGRRHDD